MPELSALSDAELAVLVRQAGGLARGVESLQARIAAEVSVRSGVELGAEGFARRQGYRSAAGMLGQEFGASVAEGRRLLRVGAAVAPRQQLGGHFAPAKHPQLAAALHEGRLGVAAAGSILALLDRVAPRCTAADLELAERTLAEQAPGLSQEQLRKLLLQAERWLDPDGAEPSDEERHRARSLRISQQPDGMVRLEALLDAESAAPVITAIQAFTTAALRQQSGAVLGDSGAGLSIGQLQADSLAAMCRHALDCASGELPTGGATVIVRIGLDELQQARGVADVDGLDVPVSVSAARRLAAGGGVIPAVLGGDSEMLDWGREKRLFTPAQKLALAERDGGCAACGAPAALCQVHHLRWWWRDQGKTDLRNGIVLCSACHHRIHRDEWQIRVDGVGMNARVWFIPPPHLDPEQVPRLGGRRRFDYTPAA